MIDDIKTINGVNFTRREIDIISFLLAGRRIKTIAKFLAIAPKTVATHIYNISQKLKKDTEKSISRDDIINFVYSSGKFSQVIEYYLKVSHKIFFEQQLKKISLLIDNNGPTCGILNKEKEIESLTLLENIKKYLILSGIKILDFSNIDGQSIEPINGDKKYINSVIFIIFNDYQLNKNNETIIAQYSKQNYLISNEVIFLSKNQKVNADYTFNDKIKHISLNQSNDYFFAIFEILQILLPNVNVCKIFNEFKQQFVINNSINNSNDYATKNLNHNFISFNQSRKWNIWSIITGVISISICAVFLLSKQIAPLNKIFPACNKDVAWSQYLLGMEYEAGKNDLPPDLIKARNWYEKAAVQDCPEAAYALGNIYINGIGVPRNYQKALSYYTKAAKQGYSNAQYALGNMYSEGKGTSKNDYIALTWIIKAANNGHPKAQYVLGNMYEEGRGIIIDYKIAAKSYQKSADQGYLKAQYSLGCMYMEGKGVPKSYQKALEWLTKAAYQGHSIAKSKIEELLNVNQKIF